MSQSVSTYWAPVTEAPCAFYVTEYTDWDMRISLSPPIKVVFTMPETKEGKCYL